LTAETQQIALLAAPNLCLDVQGGNAAAGTPVWLWDCNEDVIPPDSPRDTEHRVPVDAQRWTYDPEAGALQNALGTILHVQGGWLQPATLVETGTHTGPACAFEQQVKV
jgi:hypothetical protein